MSFDEYDRLNERLAEELFSDAQAGKPVYVGAEDEALARAFATLKPDDVGSLDYLRLTVRSTLNIEDTGVSPFRWYTKQLMPVRTGSKRPRLLVSWSCWPSPQTR